MPGPNESRDIYYLRRDIDSLRQEHDQRAKMSDDRYEKINSRLMSLEGAASFAKWCFMIIGGLIVVAIATNLLKVGIPEFKPPMAVSGKMSP